MIKSKTYFLTIFAIKNNYDFFHCFLSKTEKYHLFCLYFIEVGSLDTTVRWYLRFGGSEGGFGDGEALVSGHISSERVRG
jgi:hypothetical protein